MQSEYMPIGGSELLQLQLMHGFNRCLAGDESLKTRMESIGIWWRWKGAVKQLLNMYQSTWNTIEPAKRARINQVWDQQELRIVNANAPVDTSGDVMVVPKAAVVLMAQKLQEDACGMCFGGHQDRKDCKFRRAMLELSIPDLRRYEKKTGKCLGHIYGWGDQL